MNGISHKNKGGGPATGKEGIYLELTRDNLARLRQQGLSNAEIARMAGKSTSSINRLFSRHKIAPRQRIPGAAVEEMVRLRRAGKSLRQIAGKTGYSESAVRNRLILEGCQAGSRKKETGCFDLPETIMFFQVVFRRRKTKWFNGKVLLRLMFLAFILMVALIGVLFLNIQRTNNEVRSRCYEAYSILEEKHSNSIELSSDMPNADFENYLSITKRDKERYGSNLYYGAFGIRSRFAEYITNVAREFYRFFQKNHVMIRKYKDLLSHT